MTETVTSLFGGDSRQQAPARFPAACASPIFPLFGRATPLIAAPERLVGKGFTN